MKCPFCDTKKTQVLESRVVEDGKAIRRRRECLKCTKRFTTLERVRGNSVWVIKKDGTREPFDREKIKRGVMRSIEKRPVGLKLVDDLAEQVEREVFKRESQEVQSKLIGSAVLRRLKKIDKVAWLRFASVYLEFSDLGDFEKVIWLKSKQK
ncbi:transcriptional regulator NrdR [Candidatus Woesebacteria bacterium RIFCSPHIGHO2_02_FULL_42_20]|uniref:Transcriptional repressor NrdR n=1 Tax=Candidatus Woesebacteria bacterium RIFCSPHIGHO2_12_FULL_41_24 TaxID=1802510 RepID=A0A1F8ATK5_9BACT|nr:MAG: transcriptional regulator NrdR [Candidatus Woesebacteria bacterium RBG_16_41_13]OGM30400.1 MAG: transcriptional regulator NrdR [Candidatus Woesebacteria bacterium RIFCSPHIGHO2_01_FULL_42_80]OGM35446.1 MAG: transcriptional regulator NrdR [Candidatus Woesebacteria bacterium RIFCSPHIGHO2_02_FULL_42_20]OGM55021.1 MAG: transcriptional regulator NrdR [Candidatus Woesebacteria bacterium RIFCSPHIGHO2_12_FULL_41_24]OGM66367.1 MAG: transcriptional regulator NrdR [Candidatus Woesebacteria bacteriu